MAYVNANEDRVFSILWEPAMTKLLKKAIKELESLPDEKQDAYAREIMSLLENDVMEGWTLGELREEIRKGLESGESSVLDMNEIKRAARTKWERRTAS